MSALDRDRSAIQGWMERWARENSLYMVERAQHYQLREVVENAIEELDGEHGPVWASDEMKRRGKEPIGCRICFPGDGSWPCTTRMVTDDLRHALNSSHEVAQ